MQKLSMAAPLLHCVTGVRVLAGSTFEVVGMQSSAECITGLYAKRCLGTRSMEGFGAVMDVTRT